MPELTPPAAFDITEPRVVKQEVLERVRIGLMFLSLAHGRCPQCNSRLSFNCSIDPGWSIRGCPNLKCSWVAIRQTRWEAS